jgi:pyruvate kinase
VERAEDVVALRQAAKDLNYDPFVIAKIERARGLDRIDEILEQADGIMIARGDLGVEVPIEQIAVVQKRLMRKANLLGKPVITATQMLESMTAYPRPTRAESTDVANAILDGTDCVMLSEESAMGRYPVDAVAMLTKIAATVEPWVSGREVRREVLASGPKDQFTLRDLIAASVVATVDRMTPAAVFVPTRTGATARSITRFRLPALIVAVSSHEATCSRLQFSFGVHPVHEPDHPEDWREYARKWLSSHGVEGNLVVLTEGPSSKHPEANHRMEIIDLSSSRK